MSNLDLLPRADLPVIWEDFKAKVDKVRRVSETLTVTSIDQKEDMALARKIRLTLREIRIAVEHKRVELGEGHLKEIQKVNGAAKAIREFIELLEARLLLQETFAERAEALRIEESFKVRFNELCLLRPGRGHPPALGSMSPSEYLKVVAEFTQDRDELEAANRLRVEAERRLAEAQVEAERQRKETEAKLAAAEAERREEQKCRDDEAEQVRFEQEEKHRAELSAASAIRILERQAAEQRRQEDLRIEREKTAVLEAELKAERAVKLAEAEAARKLALAPDVEKLRAYRQAVKDLPVPSGLAPEAEQCFCEAVYALAQGLRILDQFCERNAALLS